MQGADNDPPGRRSLLGRLGWFVLLWLGGVAAVGLLAMLIRWALIP